MRLADCSVNARPGVVPGRAARTRVSPGSNLAPTLPCTSRHRACPSRCGLDLPTPAPPGVLGRPRCLGPPGTVRSMPGIPQSRVQLTVTDRRAQHGGGALFGRVQRPPKASINLLERCTRAYVRDEDGSNLSKVTVWDHHQILHTMSPMNGKMEKKIERDSSSGRLSICSKCSGAGHCLAGHRRNFPQGTGCRCLPA